MHQAAKFFLHMGGWIKEKTIIKFEWKQEKREREKDHLTG